MSTYYVSKEGGASDANSGLTALLPWLTVSKVNGFTFTAGDSIVFRRGGSWPETLTPPSSGSPGSPITLGAYGPGAPPILAGQDTRSTCLTISGRSWLVVAGIAMTDATLYGVKVDNSATNITLDALSASGCGNSGIIAYDETGDVQTDILVTGCIAFDNVEAGITVLERNHRVTLRGNTCYANATATSGTNSGGIRVKAEDGVRSNDLVVEDNLCYGNGVGVTTGRGFGFYLDSLGTGAIVRRNACWGNYTDGGVLEWTDGGKVHHNLFYGNGRHGFSLWRRSNANTVAHNVAYGNALNAFGGGFSLNGPGEGPIYFMSNNVFRNNLSLEHDATGFELTCNGGMQNDGTNGSGNVYTHNGLGVQYGNFIYWGASPLSTYAAWETAYGASTNSVTADPQFVNAAGGDFHLTVPTSPCIDVGVVLAGINDGYLGFRPDLGAFESSPVSGGQDSGGSTGTGRPKARDDDTPTKQERAVAGAVKTVMSQRSGRKFF